MNIITNLLYSLYFYYFIIPTPLYFSLFSFAILFPYIESFLILFIKNKLIIYNKVFHSLPILLFINTIIAILISSIKSITFYDAFLVLFLGTSFHLFTDIIKNKDIHIFYPFTKKGYSLSLSNYFDPIPIIILMTTIFIFIFKDKGELNWPLKIIPFLLLLIIFLIKYLIKRVIIRSLDINDQNLMLPTFNFSIWQIILVKESGSIIYRLNIINRKFESLKYFPSDISNESLELLNHSGLFKEFNKKYKYLYKKEYKNKGINHIMVFDLKNFFSLFKREQIYFEMRVKDNKIIKEYIRL